MGNYQGVLNGSGTQLSDVHVEQGIALLGCFITCMRKYLGVLDGSENEPIDAESLLDLCPVGRNFKNDQLFIKYEFDIT